MAARRAGSARLKVTPSGGGAGAFVSNVNLATARPGTFDKLRSALGEHGVLFFRDQELTPEQHERVAESFAPINVNRFFGHVENHPRIAEVRKEPEQTKNIGGGWHTDHSYDDVPAMGSMLLARETPPTGGDTLFASTCRAWETLSDGMKETLRTLRAVHSSSHVFGAAALAKRTDMATRLGNPDLATQEAVHPVVIEHPISGKPSLYVNPGFTLRFDGWTDDESRGLLDTLYAHISRPEHTYRFSWAPGSLALWDNRGTWHYAVNDYHGARRLMHRITLEGVALKAA